MTDVAARCGVSYQTVSRVINEMPEVADATRTRVRRAIEQLGYRPNMTARHLVSRRSTVLGHVSFAIGLYGPSQTMVNVEESAKQAGYRVMFSGVVDPNINEISRAVNELCSHRLAGILIYLPLEIDLSVLRSLCQNIPVVAMDSDLNFKTTAVMVQQKSGSRIATEHLINLGHRRIAYIGKTARTRDAIERIAGYRAALDSAHLPIDPQLECAGDFNEVDGYTATRALLALPEPPTAIFAGNDRQAAGVYRALHEAGMTVPGDMSVIGFDNLPFTELLSPPLTTIHAPRLELGRTAAAMLLRLINGEPMEMPRVVLPTQFIERQSCRTLSQ